MSKNKAVVILTVAYNAEKWICRCIDSVLNQTYKDFVYYVCDNGSKDDTRTIINGYAQNDRRVLPIYFDDNNWRLMPLITAILLEYEDGYFLNLDADDEYNPDFIKKMLAFINKHDLDLAVCGSDSINAETYELIARKELGKNLILSGKGFLKKFPIYRKYVYDYWGKIYTLSALRKACVGYIKNRTSITGRNSELFNYFAFKLSKKVGIFGKSLHKYYIFPNSLSSLFFPGRIEASVLIYNAARDYLLSFGQVDKTNQDYLYAIYFGQINDTLNRLYNADLPYEKKLNYINQILNYPLTKEMLAHEANAQFGNLADRDKFVSDINNWIDVSKPCGSSKVPMKRRKINIFKVIKNYFFSTKN